MNDQSKTKHVLILEMASLRQGSNELKQSESECKKENGMPEHKIRFAR
jgi:hypothetical protein